MRTLIILIGLLLITAMAVPAQIEDTLPVGAVRERSLPAVESAEEFRPVGDYRVWRFFGKQTTFGKINSTVKGLTEIDGREALILEEELQVDYTKIGSELQIEVSGESYVSFSGHYLGSKLTVGATGAQERLEMMRHGERLEGFYTRSGSEHDIDHPIGGDYFFWDMNFVDQLEYFLAMQDLAIGTQINDSIFMPQSMIAAPITGQVLYFMWQEIYKGKIDSVFIIRMTEPVECQLYWTPDRRLVRVDFLEQGIRLYQDFAGVRQTPPTASTESVGSLRSLLFKLPHYVAFVVIAGIVVLFFAAQAFRWSDSYLFLGAGILVYFLVPMAANPLIALLVEGWVHPALASGSSLLAVGIVPSVLLALIQTGLLVGAIYGLTTWLKPKEYRSVGLGAFLGAGFGLTEAIIISGLSVTYLFDWALAERVSFILLHTVSGALIGKMLGERSKSVGLIILTVLGVNTLGRYLPLLVQSEWVDIEAMHFVLGVLMLAYLLFAQVLVKKMSDGGAATDGEAS